MLLDVPPPDPDDPLAVLRAELMAAGLDRDGVLDDPVAMFRRWFDQATAAGVHEPEAAVLATADARGRPSVRHVLVKQVDERGFTFFTNADSQKGRELAENPWAALCFPWNVLARQVRVAGPVAPIAAEESDAYFASRPRGSRIGAWASPQSSVLADRAELEARVAEAEAAHPEADVPRPPHWGGYRIRPDEVEVWQGRPSRLHDRFRYRRLEGSWLVERLSP